MQTYTWESLFGLDYWTHPTWGKVPFPV